MNKTNQKEILLVGEENRLLLELQQTISGEEFRFVSNPSGEVSAEEVSNADLIFLNGTGDHSVCIENIVRIKNFPSGDTKPLLVLVDNDNSEIQEILSLGITDYVAPNEDVETIIHRLRIAFGQSSDVISSDINIITPEVIMPIGGLRVYIVEDDPLLSNLLSIRFTKSSFPHEFNHDGENCLPAIKQFKPDVIILDIMLPKKSGFDILAEIRADFTLDRIPVIMFSNRDGQEDRQKALDMGANSFKVKAMTDLSELVVILEHLVADSRKNLVDVA